MSNVTLKERANTAASLRDHSLENISLGLTCAQRRQPIRAGLRTCDIHRSSGGATATRPLSECEAEWDGQEAEI